MAEDIVVEYPGGKVPKNTMIDLLKTNNYKFLKDDNQDIYFVKN